MKRLAAALLFAASGVGFSPATPQPRAVHVPFVGCESDGQQGPQPAPKRPPKLVHISKVSAQRLAYYAAEDGLGVLAPRGWFCFGTYGSNGSSIYVSPQPITSSMFFSDTPEWKGLDGPAIQLSDMSGSTSGRFSVARMIARVFPAHHKFVRDVIAEGLEPAKDFPFGPYPNDKLTYKGKEIVEYETPARMDGLGTDSWLLKNDSSIRGVALLVGADTDCYHLSARLQSDLVSLTPSIVHQVEFDAIHQQ
jgi:hypothetical protein